MSPELGFRKNPEQKMPQTEISNKEAFAGNVDKMVEKRLPMFREDYKTIEAIDKKLATLSFEGSEADKNDMKATEIALLQIRQELKLDLAKSEIQVESDGGLDENAVQAQLEVLNVLYEKRTPEDAAKSIEKRLNSLSKEIIELSRSSDDAELTAALVEQEALDRMLDMLDQKTARPKAVKLATAYGGSVAAAEVGAKKTEAKEIRIANVEQAEMISKLIEQKKQILLKKINAGMDVNDILEGINFDIEGAEDDIAELDNNQETIIKEAINLRAVSLELKKWLESEEYKKAA